MSAAERFTDMLPEMCIRDRLREVPYSGQSIDGEGFMIEDFPDLNCDVEHCVLTKMEQQDIHKVINQLNSEERMIIYGIFFENKTQTQLSLIHI